MNAELLKTWEKALAVSLIDICLDGLKQSRKFSFIASNLLLGLELVNFGLVLHIKAQCDVRLSVVMFKPDTALVFAFITELYLLIPLFLNPSENRRERKCGMSRH